MEFKADVFLHIKRYEGEYKNDLNDGYGTFKWKDGREYSGRYHGCTLVRKPYF